MKSLIVIPARLASTRLPEKMLLDRTGKPLVQHTYEAARKSKLAAGIIVATDDKRIQQAVQGFQGEVVLTRPDHATGTDRIAEVALENEGYDIFVNVQGDEPEIEASAIDLAIQLLNNESRVAISTLATPIRQKRQLDDPSCVKVVIGSNGHALYFSRAAIPYVAGPQRDEKKQAMLNQKRSVFYQHVGLYAYRRDFLLEFSQLPQSEIETTENLEQLRVLDAGHSIAVGVIESVAAGIDTADDYEAFVSRQANC